MQGLYMCSPAYFDVIHNGLNYHMNMHRPVQQDLALSQWNNLKSILAHESNVSTIPPKSNLVDMVFAANGALLYKDQAVVANFAALPRKEESVHWASYLHDAGYTIHSPPMHFEGQGDALFSHDNRTLWIGHGFRSDVTAAAYIQSLFADVEVLRLGLVDSRWYHLDTCFCPLGGNKLLAYPNAFDYDSYEVVKQQFGVENIIEVTEADALDFACNAVHIGSKIVLNKASDALVQLLQQHGFTVIQTDMSEFLLSGGSCKCCVMHAHP